MALPVQVFCAGCGKRVHDKVAPANYSGPLAVRGCCLGCFPGSTGATAPTVTGA